MIVRIVKMTFQPEKVEGFINEFQSKKLLIAAFEGCKGVKLLRDVSNPNIFFTISDWYDGAALENYRQSELFTGTWREVKKWFAAKPEAWSLEDL